MAGRATWRGYLKLGEVVSAVGLYTAVSTSDRVSLHMVNRATGNRLLRRFIDPETGAEVPREDQVKGYEIGSGDYVMIEGDEVAAVTPTGDKTLAIDAFIPSEAVDDLFLERPYYLAPGDDASAASFALIREGLKAKKAVALANGVLFRRPHLLLLRAHDEGIVATMLASEHEVRSAKDAFRDIRAIRIEGEMLDLARHIIDTKAGRFEPEGFDDRYDAALAELVKAKLEGRTIRAPKAPPKTKGTDLLEALRQSAGRGGRGAEDGAQRDKAKAKKKPARKATGGAKPAARPARKAG